MKVDFADVELKAITELQNLTSHIQDSLLTKQELERLDSIEKGIETATPFAKTPASKRVAEDMAWLVSKVRQCYNLLERLEQWRKLHQ